MNESSFGRGEGRWRGAAEVYDARGRFLGGGHDSRVVRRDLGGGTVEVEVSFTGPFRMSGRYVIADRGDHRLYQGPLNYGYAEAFGGGLIDAHNYWPDVGFSQRFFLMVLPGGRAQLSLALLGRGEQAAYTVVGEYSRQSGREPAFAPGSAYDLADDPRAGRGVSLLERPGTWSGTLAVVGAEASGSGDDDAGSGDDDAGSGDGSGGVEYCEQVEPRGGGRRLAVSIEGTGFGGDAAVVFTTDGWQHWTGRGAVTGSESLWGGRALAGNLIFADDRLRLWRREVARADGTCKAVLHTWYRGGARVGVAYGVLDFAPAP